MSNTHAKRRGTKLTASEKKQAQFEANRKARMQWYIVGALIVLAVVGAIILISVMTEGSLPSLYNPNG